MNRWVFAVTTTVVLSGWTCLTAGPNEDLSAALSSLSGYRAERVESRELTKNESTAWEGVAEDIVAEYTPVNAGRWTLKFGGRTTLRLETLQMLDAPGAYGLLSFWVLQRPTPPRRLASTRRAYRANGRVVWSSGRHLFSVSADEATATRLIEDLGQALSDPDVAPVTAQYLPSADRLDERSAFYLGPQGATADPDLPRWMIPLVEFHSGVELSVARYRSRPPFFLLGYPTPASARAAMERLEESPDAGRMSFKRSVVLIGASPESSPALDSLTYAAQISWIKEKPPFDPRIPPADMFEILRSWVFFTGAFVLIVLGTGGLIGGVRYGLRRRFPAWAARDDMIRLGIDDG